jgi:hypothetical protein
MSYGTNKPFGFQPSQYIDGSSWTGQTGEYTIASGYNGNNTGISIFTGDPVTTLADGTIGRAVAGDQNPIMGIFWGVQYTDLNGNPVRSPYWAAGTVTKNNVAATAYVVDDPYLLWDVQADAATVNVGFASTDRFANANVLFTTAGSPATGQSGATLGPVAPGTATNQFKIIRLTPNPKNAWGIPNNNVLVLINNHVYKGGTGTAGV